MAVGDLTKLGITDTAELLDQLPVAVTVTDTVGRLVFYNKKASEMLDRKPEYIGGDIRSCHKEAHSVDVIDRLMAAYRENRDEVFEYRGVRKGIPVKVIMRGLFVGETCVGCLHTVIPQETGEKA